MSQLIDSYLLQLDECLDPTRIIQSAADDPHLFQYGAILDHPKVGNSNALVRTLAFGSYRDLSVGVSDAVRLKMKKLDILSCVVDSGLLGVRIQTLCGRVDATKVLLFQILLEMTTIDRLMDFRIDERNDVLNVSKVHLMRDVHPDEWPGLRDRWEALAERVREMQPADLSRFARIEAMLGKAAQISGSV